MNTELFIAKHITGKSSEKVSRLAVKIAIVSIALGLAVMIISVAIVTGFQDEIESKVTGFGAHIQISNYDNNLSMEASPVSREQEFYPGLKEVDGISHVQVFANKAGIIKTNEQIQGVVLKGIGQDYDWSFFADKIIKGRPLKTNDTTISEEILISRSISNLLQIDVGDAIRMYFVSSDQSRPRGRKFTVAGIYETGLQEFDEMFVLGDIRHVISLNRWSDDQVGGFEVYIDDLDELDKMTAYVFDRIPYDLDARSVKDIYPQIFEWLALQDKNVIIIIILMVLVSGITMISTLLILILERTNMIGVLKAMGARNISIRKIFLYNAAYIIGIGLLWGNLFGIGLCLVQDFFEVITLNQESYYVSVVPVNLELFPILVLNAGTLIACVAMLIIPSFIITRITPVKAIRFS
ncbi:MAG: FtsX-like permease family protein [Bacteroidota bacterium]|nr:FtsX-like permease family protein [Bacteroidota bacterium]